MVLPPHRDGGQAQYIDAPLPAPHGEDAIGATLAWALNQLDQPPGIPRLAAKAGFSERHFVRTVRQRTGTTVLKWLLHQRVLRAQRLLETTDETVERVAQLSGFSTATSLRPHFQRQVQCSPSAYRRTFRGPATARL